jgi:hypothetical protein
MYDVLYCRFSRKKLTCPYSDEERTLELCTVCKVARVTSQQLETNNNTLNNGDEGKYEIIVGFQASSRHN